MNCNIEIGSVTGLGKRLVDVDIDSFPLINTPLQRGDLWGADLQLFQQFDYVREGAKNVKTVRIGRVIAATQLKLGVNEKLLSKLLLQVTSRACLQI